MGSMPMARIIDLRREKHDVLQRELHQRSAKTNLRQAIQRGTSMTYVSPEGALSFLFVGTARDPALGCLSERLCWRAQALQQRLTKSSGNGACPMNERQVRLRQLARPAGKITRPYLRFGMSQEARKDREPGSYRLRGRLLCLSDLYCVCFSSAFVYGVVYRGTCKTLLKKTLFA